MLLLTLLIPAGRDAAWSLLMLADFVAGDAPSVFKRLTQEPARTSSSLASADGAHVPFDVYTPVAVADLVANSERLPAILLTHGLAHDGNRDRRVIAHARRLARAGFVVMTPDLGQMKTYRLGFADIAAVAGALEFLFASAIVDSSRVGAIAPSFGAGPVLIALARAELRTRVHFALVVGAYYDLQRTLRYTLTGAYENAGFATRAPATVNQRSRWRFLHGNLDLIPRSHTRRQFDALVAERRNYPRRDDKELRARLSGEEQLMLEFTANEEPAVFDSLYPRLPETFRSWIDTFSLRHYTPDIKTRLIILHSDADKKVPYPESLVLSRSLPNAPAPHVAIVSVFSHVDLRLDWSSLRTVFNEVLPGLAELWEVSFEIMRLRRS